MIRWGYLAAGLGAVAIVAIIAVLMTASGNGIWIVAFLPICAVGGGALVLAGRDDSIA